MIEKIRIVLLKLIYFCKWRKEDLFVSLWNVFEKYFFIFYEFLKNVSFYCFNSLEYGYDFS